MDRPHQAMPDIEVLPAHFPASVMGFLPINSFVIKDKEPKVPTSPPFIPPDQTAWEQILTQMKDGS